MKNKIYIAGAHSRGITLGHYLTYLDSSIDIQAYLFDNEEKNPDNVNGIPVIKIDETSKLNTEYPVYIGTRGVNHSHLIKLLTSCGMKKIIPVDMNLDMKLRNEFLKKYYEMNGCVFNKLDNMEPIDGKTFTEEKKIALYIVSSIFDKPLITSNRLNKHEKIIQVGTDISDEKMDADCFDNEGENISCRNSQFCELTGLFWIWKNAKEDIVGLEHYRRHFILPDDWTNRMVTNEIDVILPVPLYVDPSIEGNYRARHAENNWDNMLEYLQENSVEEYITASRFFKDTSLYSPCNMFIMKREILNELCSWMFPILFAVADRGGILEDTYQNRYPGFISERLITYFFNSNRDKYKVVYADKNFLK